MQLLPKPEKNGKNGHHAPSLDTGRSEDPHPINSLPLYPPTQGFATHNALESWQETWLERVVVLIDGSNLFYAASLLSLEIDYLKLLRCLVHQRRLVRAYFYTGVDATNEKQQGFLLWMRRNGYRVISKDLVQFPDGSKKANLEVEMAIDMIQMGQYCDTVVLLSGNGDLAYAVNAISYRGVQVEVVSMRSMTSDRLINVADRYIDLDSIKLDIRRT